MSLNMIGQEVKKARTRLGWSQSLLATRLQLSGWDISRSGVSKIEDRAVYVHDYQVAWLAAVLEVPRESLYPRLDPARPVQAGILKLIHNPRRGLVQPSAFS